MAAIDHNCSALRGPTSVQLLVRPFARVVARLFFLALAGFLFDSLPADLARAQDDDGITCRPGTHCAPHLVGHPCIVCIPDAPPPIPPPVVDWRNNNSGGRLKSGHEDGTASNPFRTLTRALNLNSGPNAAHPGDTLTIRAGFYNTEEPLVFDKALNIRVENGPVTIYAHRTDDILTSMDVPGSQPLVDAQTCRGGLYLHVQRELVPNEWMQPPGGEALPALGLVVNKSDPDDDLRWDHPFGFDYWWSVAIDDERYLPLLDKSSLAPMFCSHDGDVCDASKTAKMDTGRDPKGILHTEIEDRLLPDAYRPRPGDRVYMWGHRIADCGHEPVGAEMHPPTLVATAKVSPDDGSLRTTVLAMPYLTTQSYETGADFPSAATVSFGLAAVSPLGILTGLPMVARTSARPFNVPIVATYAVAVPPVPHRATALSLHYHFVTRPGVNVMVNPDVTGVPRAVVMIRMDPAAYVPFSDANCHKETVSLETFDADARVPRGTIRNFIDGLIAASAAAGLFIPLVPIIPPGSVPPGVIFTANAGMQVATCDFPNRTPGMPGSVNDNAVVIDASQPYPVYGWLSYD